MDWENERYVRLYVRETVDDAVLSWEARALWHELLKRFDRAGVLDMGAHGWKGVALLARMPAAVVAAAGAELIDDGRIELRGAYLVAKNFIDAQEAKQSDKQRAAEMRARRRDRTRAAAELGLDVTERDTSSQNVTKEAENVTAGHIVSQPVTPSCAVPSHAVPSRAVPSQDLSCSPEASELFPYEATEPLSRFDFEPVYKLYPRKQGKARGLRTAKAKIRTEAAFQAFREAVETMAAAWAVATPEQLKFCPHWSTFVSQERWKDDELPRPEPSRSNGAGGGYHHITGDEHYDPPGEVDL